MELPVALMAESVGEGNIYFFTDACPIGVAGHMHVCIKRADDVNKFTKDLTYLNCNNVIRCGLGDFSRMLRDGSVRRQDGDLTEADLEMVAKGVRLSTVVPADVKKLF